MQLTQALSLAGYALGALGGALLFAELFLLPSYVEYNEDRGNYVVQMAPETVVEHSWAGRVGAFALALAFATLFVAELV
jgi:hypothetical protein